MDQEQEKIDESEFTDAQRAIMRHVECMFDALPDNESRTHAMRSSVRFQGTVFQTANTMLKEMLSLSAEISEGKPRGFAFCVLMEMCKLITNEPERLAILHDKLSVAENLKRMYVVLAADTPIETRVHMWTHINDICATLGADPPEPIG
jgi:hypothetical protein